ncbi:hypothetical protein [Bacillus sp. JCM 19041]|uniref:hypothetical protein n=1 Tax=Bacillus sp. JCM 19041 TaxID=1460637 RepID=UPI0006D1FF10
MALDFQFALETMPELLFGDKIHFVHDGVEKAYTVTGLYSGYGDGTEVLALGEVSIGDLYVATSSEDVKQTQDVIAEQTGLRPKVNYNHMETDWLPYYEQNPTLKSTIYVLIVALFLFTVTCTYALARQIKLALQNDYLTLLRLGLSPRKYKRDMTVLGTILAVGITGLSTGVGFLFYHFVGVDAVLSIDTLRQSSYYFEIGTIHLLFPSTMLMFVALSLFVVFMFILTVALSSRKKVRKERSHIKPAVVVVLSTVFLLLVQVIDSANGYLKEANGSHEVEEDFVYIQFLREDQEDLIMGELREKLNRFWNYIMLAIITSNLYLVNQMRMSNIGIGTRWR